MKFLKTLIINIPEPALESFYWEQIDEGTEKRVSLLKDSPDTIKELSDTDCLLINFGIIVSKEMIDAAPNLKYIGTLSTAYGKVDVAYAKEKKIPVSNLAGYSTESVAEFTIAAILEQIRALETGKLRARQGNYSEESLSAREIKGSTFGVVGLGSIGRRVAELAAGFGANVKYWSRNKKDTPFTYENIDTLLREADFLSINLAQTPDTENFLDAEKLQVLKKGSVVVNTSPMDIVNIDALAEKLKLRNMTFILDHSDEMTKEDLAKLSVHKNCVIYPPIAYITEEARKTKQAMFVNNIKSYLAGIPVNVVNP
jgi:lactate dehydrogenase-like 2-hydroxyacid dehydrogenase